jgi:hypothetical protein
VTLLGNLVLKVLMLIRITSDLTRESRAKGIVADKNNKLPYSGISC